jgi:hypothetical protein
LALVRFRDGNEDLGSERRRLAIRFEVVLIIAVAVAAVAAIAAA